MGWFCHLSEFFSSLRVRKNTRHDGCGGSGSRELPDDLIADILSRLPAESILKHRRVCKRWLDLTSTSYFAQLHLKRHTTTTSLLLHTRPRQYSKEWTLDLFQFGENSSTSTGVKNTNTRKIRGDLIGWGPRSGDDLQIRASCDGLLVFEYMHSGSLRLFVVCNVITREQVTAYGPAVKFPSPMSTVHALFLHPVTKEYTMLYQNHPAVESHNYDFYLYSFTSKLWRQISSFHCVPKYFNHPVLFNNMLHWMTETRDCDTSIFMLDTITEEFRVMPHPGDRYSGQEDHELLFMYESAKGSSLCLCWVKREVVEIWMLAKYDDWCWIKWTVIDLGYNIRPLFVYKQELVFPVRGELYSVNLQKRNQKAAALIVEDHKGRMKDLIKKKIERDDIMVMFSWTASFVSLKA